MKKFYINEKLFTIGDKFDIFDENNNIAYFAKEKIFTFGKQYNVYNKRNQEVSYIKQQVFNFLPRYELYVNGEVIATVSKKFTFFYAQYNITSKYGDYTISGDLLKWNFDIMRDSKIVCGVHKNFTLFKDRYEITIYDDTDEVFAVSLVIILDAIHHNGRRNHH